MLQAWVFPLFIVFTLTAETLTLQNAQSRSLKQGYQVLIDEADNSARQWQKRNVIAGYLPQVNYRASFMRYEQSTVDDANFMYGNFSGVNDTTGYIINDLTKNYKMRDNSLTHEFSITQPVSNGGAEIVAIAMAEHTRAAQEQTYSANRGNLIVQIHQAYYELVKDVEYRLMGEQELKWAQRNYETASIKKESGILPITDFLRWEREVNEKKASLVQTDALIAFHRAQLNALMGDSPSSNAKYIPEKFEVFENSFDSLVFSQGKLKIMHNSNHLMNTVHWHLME